MTRGHPVLRILLAVTVVCALALQPAAGGADDAAGAGGTSGTTVATSDLRVWREFVDMLRAGPFPPDRVRPHREELRAPLIGFLTYMREGADWAEWEVEPRVSRVDDTVHFVLPLTFDGQDASYCFSFVTEGGDWHFQHLEGIALRLDDLGPLPVSEFPELPEPMMAWMRAEIEVSRDVWLLNALAAEKGFEAALDWFRDGAGYALAAKTWVPFVRPERAFVLYLCWEQARLRGNLVVLEELTDTSATVRMAPMYLLLYEKTGHLKQQIEYEEYVALFEFRWKDRAENAGWRTEFEYEGAQCVFHLSR